MRPWVEQNDQLGNRGRRVLVFDGQLIETNWSIGRDVNLDDGFIGFFSFSGDVDLPVEFDKLVASLSWGLVGDSGGDVTVFGGSRGVDVDCEGGSSS